MLKNRFLLYYLVLVAAFVTVIYENSLIVNARVRTKTTKKDDIAAALSSPKTDDLNSLDKLSNFQQSTNVKNSSKLNENADTDNPTKSLMENQLKSLLKSLILQSRDRIESNVNHTATTTAATTNQDDNLMKLSTPVTKSQVEYNDQDQSVGKKLAPIEDTDDELNLATVSISKLVDDTIERRVKEAQQELSKILMKSLEKRIKHASELLQNKNLTEKISPNECKDAILGCSVLRDQNMCNLEKKLMQRDCKLTCEFCEVPEIYPTIINRHKEIDGNSIDRNYSNNIKNNYYQVEVDNDEKYNSKSNLTSIDNANYEPNIKNIIELNSILAPSSALNTNNNNNNNNNKNSDNTKLAVLKTTSKKRKAINRDRKTKNSKKLKKVAKLKSNHMDKKEKSSHKTKSENKNKLLKKVKPSISKKQLNKKSHHKSSGLTVSAKKQSSTKCPSNCTKKLCHSKCPKQCCSSNANRKAILKEKKDVQKNKCPANCPAHCKPDCKSFCCNSKNLHKKINVSNINLVNTSQKDYKSKKPRLNQSYNKNFQKDLKYTPTSKLADDIYNKNQIFAPNYQTGTCGDYCSSLCFPVCTRECCENSRPNENSAIQLFSDNVLSNAEKEFEFNSNSQIMPNIDNPSSAMFGQSELTNNYSPETVALNNQQVDKFDSDFDPLTPKSSINLNPFEINPSNNVNTFSPNPLTNINTLTSNPLTNRNPFSIKPNKNEDPFEAKSIINSDLLKNNFKGNKVDSLLDENTVPLVGNNIDVDLTDVCPPECQIECTENCPKSCCPKINNFDLVNPINKLSNTKPTDEFYSSSVDKNSNLASAGSPTINDDDYDQVCSSCKYRCDDQCVLKGCCDK